MTFDRLYTEQEKALRIVLNQLYDSGMSWREIGEIQEFKDIGISFGTLNSIANDNPIPKKWIEKLGFSLPIEVYPCPVHKTIHLYDCQTQKVENKTKAMPKKLKKLRRFESWLFGKKQSELVEMLENRKEMK